MKFASTLQRGTLIKRYKRFLADVETAQGEIITIHCPNTGSMRHCAEPGFGVWYSDSGNPKRKYRCTWELAEDFHGNLIGINTNNANKLVKEALEHGVISELSDFPELRTEVKYGEENSRIDLLLSGQEVDCYVEVKSVTLLEDEQGFFPDAVSTRGQKHLRELAKIAAARNRAILFYCVQHTGIETVQPAREIDPAYADALLDAQSAGVEVLAYGCNITPEAITLQRKLEFMSA
jgi:sugar fermentation stimulation protein A